MKIAVLQPLFLVSYCRNHNDDITFYNTLVYNTILTIYKLFVTDAATNARFLCEQVYLCSPDVIIEEYNGKKNIAQALDLGALQPSSDQNGSVAPWA